MIPPVASRMPVRPRCLFVDRETFLRYALGHSSARHCLRNGFDAGGDGREVTPWEMERLWGRGEEVILAGAEETRSSLRGPGRTNATDRVQYQDTVIGGYYNLLTWA
jgi:hypothetical protein